MTLVVFFGKGTSTHPYDGSVKDETRGMSSSFDATDLGGVQSVTSTGFCSSRAAGESVSRAAVPETEMPDVGWGNAVRRGCGAGVGVAGGI